MRHILILFLSLFVLSGCASMQKVGTMVCNTEKQISAGVTEVGAFFGAPGNLVAGGTNIILSAFCSLMKMVTDVPQDLTDTITAPFQTERGTDPEPSVVDPSTGQHTATMWFADRMRGLGSPGGDIEKRQ